MDARQLVIKKDFWDKVSQVVMEKPHIDHPSSAFSLSQGKEQKNMHLFTSVRKEVVDRTTVILPCPTLIPGALSICWCLKLICTKYTFAKLLKRYEISTISEQQNQD